MFSKKLVTAIVLSLVSAAPAFAGCEEEIDALSKAISNPSRCRLGTARP